MRPRLFRLALEGCESPLALPKFHVVTINEVLGVFLGSFVIWTKQFDGSDEATISADDICSVVRHVTALRVDT